MPLRPKTPNVGVEHGAWGEDVAVEYLRVHGYEIVDRNVRPCRRDQRLEIDVIAYDRMYDVMAFVEVKQHANQIRACGPRSTMSQASSCSRRASGMCAGATENERRKP